MDPVKNNPSTSEEKGSPSQLPDDIHELSEKQDEEIDDTSIQEDEKQLVRKLDTRIMILLCVWEIGSRWDASSILPNVKLLGIMEDLNLTEAQYRWCLTAPFIVFMCFCIPINLVLRKSRASLLLGSLALIWGGVGLVTPAVTNFIGLIICQIIIGACAEANDPTQVYYISLWYRRYETAQRLGWFSAVGGIAGSFRGLLAYGMSQIPSTPTMSTWKWLYIIFSIPSFICGILCILLLPDKPETAKFLNSDEKQIATERLSKEQAFRTSQYSWSWKQVISVLTDWKLYCFTLLSLSDSIVLGGSRLNLPSIIDGMGYWNKQESLALTVPPNILACIVTFCLSWLSDKYQQRAYFLIGLYLLCGISIFLLMFVPDEIIGLRYFAVCLFRLTTFSFTSIRNAWASQCFSGLTRRAVAVAIFFMAVSAGNAIAGQAYFDPPRFYMGFTIALCFIVVSIVMASILRVTLSRINRKRDQTMQDYENREQQISKYGGEDLVGDRHPDYRYTF